MRTNDWECIKRRGGEESRGKFRCLHCNTVLPGDFVGIKKPNWKVCSHEGHTYHTACEDVHLAECLLDRLAR
jgi:hypothetical protein